MVMIAERCNNAEPCFQLAQRCDDFARPINMGRKPLFADKVAGNKNKVRPQSIETIDNLRKSFGRHVGASDMDVGEQQDVERRLTCSPSFDFNSGTADQRIASCVPVTFPDD